MYFPLVSRGPPWHPLAPSVLTAAKTKDLLWQRAATCLGRSVNWDFERPVPVPVISRDLWVGEKPFTLLKLPVLEKEHSWSVADKICPWPCPRSMAANLFTRTNQVAAAHNRSDWQLPSTALDLLASQHPEISRPFLPRVKLRPGHG